MGLISMFANNSQIIQEKKKKYRENVKLAW